jgi:hypothetical protein
MDPLSPPGKEAGDSDEESFFLTEPNLGATQHEFNSEQTSCFYGKSSLRAFTARAFDARPGVTPLTNTNRARAYRQEFWVTPDVISSK